MLFCIDVQELGTVKRQVNNKHHYSGTERLEQPMPPGGGGVLPYMDYIGMCRCEGYCFQAVYSRIGYINQSVYV